LKKRGFAEALAQLFERRKTNENLQLFAIASWLIHFAVPEPFQPLSFPMNFTPEKKREED